MTTHAVAFLSFIAALADTAWHVALMPTGDKGDRVAAAAAARLEAMLRSSAEDVPRGEENSARPTPTSTTGAHSSIGHPDTFPPQSSSLHGTRVGALAVTALVGVAGATVAATMVAGAVQATAGVGVMR